MAGKTVAASLRVRAPPGLRLAASRRVYACSASSGPGRAALCARGRRPAREIATREPSARSDRSRSPARPRHRPRAPQPGLTSAVSASNQAGLCSQASQAACWLFDYRTLASPTGTAARPHKRRVYLQPGGAVPGLGRGDQGIRMGPTRKGRPHCCRGIEPAGDVAATCHPGSWRRRSCRPWRPGRPARSRATRVDLRWCGHSRKRGRQAASARHRAGRQASCRPS